MLIKSNKSLYKALPQNSRGEYEISLSLDEVEELIRESINLTPKVTGRVQGTGKEALTAKTQGVCTGDKPYLNPKTNSCEAEPAPPSSRTQSQAEVQRKTQEQRKAEKDAAKPSQQARVKGLQTPRKALESFQPREAKFHGETAVEYAIAARQAWKSGDSFTAIDLMEQARNHYSELIEDKLSKTAVVAYKGIKLKPWESKPKPKPKPREPRGTLAAMNNVAHHPKKPCPGDERYNDAQHKCMALDSEAQNLATSAKHVEKTNSAEAWGAHRQLAGHLSKQGFHGSARVHADEVKRLDAAATVKGQKAWQNASPERKGARRLQRRKDTASFR